MFSSGCSFTSLRMSADMKAFVGTWTCTSVSPDIRYFPDPSIRVAPLGTTTDARGPTATILRPSTTTV